MAKMTVRVNEDGDLQLENVYSGIVLVTEDKERFGICMRDTGFEFNYGGVWYEAKGGEIRSLRDGRDTTKRKDT